MDVTSYRKTRGFTLFELMIAVAVTGVLLTVGVPSFVGMIQNNRAVSDTNDLVTSLNYGRSEAIRRGTTVTLCSSDDGATCSASNDWSSGWIVRSAGGDVLRAWPERSAGPGLISGNVSQIQFRPRGSLAPGTPPQLQLRPPYCDSAPERGRDVNINSAGRIRVTRVTCS